MSANLQNIPKIEHGTDFGTKAYCQMTTFNNCVMTAMHIIESFKEDEYFVPVSHRGLAFPKDNFLRTQLEYDGFKQD